MGHSFYSDFGSVGEFVAKDMLVHEIWLSQSKERSISRYAGLATASVLLQSCVLFNRVLSVYTWIMIMKIDETLVEKVAGLARLSFTEDEKKEFTRQFADIVEFIEQLQEVDTSDIDVIDVHGQKQTQMAEDTLEEGLSQEEALQNAPFKDAEFFLVPKVIGGEEE